MNLSTDTQNKLKIYQENFEKAYIESSREFYHSRASAYLAENGIVNYMRYVSSVASYMSNVASHVSSITSYMNNVASSVNGVASYVVCVCLVSFCAWVGG